MPQANFNTDIDSMNLEEFIHPTSIGSPAAATSNPSEQGQPMATDSSSHTGMTGGNATALQQQSARTSIARTSGASTSTTPDFGYVQRHVRKTSMDDRKVCREQQWR